MNELQTYGSFQPTGFDFRGMGLPDQQDWLVGPVSITRDSGTLARSNWTVVLADFVMEPDDCANESGTVEVHRFGHWGPGWYEIILIDPTDETNVGKATEWAATLAGYPVACEHHHSNLEHTDAHESWGRMNMAGRIEVCQRYRVSVFAARREDVPECETGEIIGYLADGC